MNFINSLGLFSDLMTNVIGYLCTFSISISPKTIDESPFVYKKFEDIEKHLRETVDIEMLAKPVYNLKSE